MMPPRIMLTGVPGVGKTSVAQSPQISDMGIAVKNFGQLMYLRGRELGIVVNPKDLETISLDQRTQLQAEATRIIGEESAAVAVVIDGHLIVDTVTGFVPGLPLDWVSKLNLSSIITLSALPSEIIARRKKEVNKYNMMKKWNDQDRIEQHQRILFHASLQYALLSHASYDMLPNPQDQLQSTIERFKDFLDAVVSEGNK